MRTLNKNKQTLYYANQDKEVPITETYYDDEGNAYELDTGETELVYGEPIEFSANISNKLDEVRWAEYGIDNSANYAQIVADKGKIPLKVGSIIWKKSIVGYLDLAETIVDEITSDYTVKGVADEGLSVDLFLLQKRVK